MRNEEKWILKFMNTQRMPGTGTLMFVNTHTICDAYDQDVKTINKFSRPIHTICAGLIDRGYLVRSKAHISKRIRYMLTYEGVGKAIALETTERMRQVVNDYQLKKLN